MVRLLSRIMDVRRGEGPLALKAFLALFFIIAAHTLLETARDAIFLGKLPAERLTFVYVGLAVLGLVVPSYNARFVRSLGRRNAVVLTLVIAAVGTVWWHFREMGPHEVYGLYVWSAIVGTVLAVQFWMFAGQLFTVAQGKRLFGGIASGGVLGAVAGGVVATGTLETMGQLGQSDVRVLLLVAAGLFLASAFVLTSLPVDEVRAPVRKKKDAASESLSTLRDYPYVRRLAVMVAVGTATLLVTDYLFKHVAKASLDADALAPFFARYYAVLNAVALVMQLFLSQRILKRVGVIAALSLLPLLLLLGSGGVLVAGSLSAVLLLKGSDGSLRHSLYRVAQELLYLPLPARVRDRAKSLIDAVFVRGTQALTAGGILLISSLQSDATVRILSVVVAIGAGAWILLTWLMRTSYLDMFRVEITRASADARLFQTDDIDLDTVEAVLAALSSDQPARVVAAMELLSESGRSRLIPGLILFHHDVEVLLKALDIVPRHDEQSWRSHAVRLAKHDDGRVRAAALRALGRACEPDLVREAMVGADPETRAHAAFQIARCEGGEDPAQHPAMSELLAEAATATAADRVHMRLGILAALREDADERWTDVLLELATSQEPSVVESVATAVVRIPDPRFVPILIDRLAVRSARGAVKNALVHIGQPALEALIEVFDAEETPTALRKHIPLVMAGFGDQAAADALAARLEGESDGHVRYRILRGLSRLVATSPVSVELALVEREMERNLVEHFRLQLLAQPLREAEAPRAATGSALLLVGLLEDKISQALERTFRLFKLRHPSEDIRRMYGALHDDDKRTRANALEFMEALALELPERCRELLRIAADDLSDEDRAARAAALLGRSVPKLSEALRRLLDDSDETVIQLAAYHVSCLGDGALSEEVAVRAEAMPALREVLAAGLVGMVLEGSSG